MKKTIIAPLFFSLLASLFSGCICKHCDPREYNVDYYLQNSMDEPVMFGVCKQNTVGNLLYFIIDTLQPNEKKPETKGRRLDSSRFLMIPTFSGLIFVRNGVTRLMTGIFSCSATVPASLTLFMEMSATERPHSLPIIGR